jgi:hypothetical protein
MTKYAKHAKQFESEIVEPIESVTSEPIEESEVEPIESEEPQLTEALFVPDPNSKEPIQLQAKSKATQFKPGQSGQSRKRRYIREALLARAESMGKRNRRNKFEEMADALYLKATKGDLNAARLIAEYVDGKPKPSEEELEASKNPQTIILAVPSQRIA